MAGCFVGDVERASCGDRACGSKGRLDLFEGETATGRVVRKKLFDGMDEDRRYVGRIECRRWFSRKTACLLVRMIANYQLLQEDAEGENVCCLSRFVPAKELWSDVARSSRDETARKDGGLGVIEAR